MTVSFIGEGTDVICYQRDYNYVLFWTLQIVRWIGRIMYIDTVKYKVLLDFKTDGFNVFVCKFDDKGLH